MITIDNDIYGRSVTSETTGTETAYTITNPNSSIAFMLTFDAGWPLVNVYSTINAMAPAQGG